MDLSGESLATRVEAKRQRMVLATNDIINKVRSSHVSVRPQPTTPNVTNGQPPPPAVKEVCVHINGKMIVSLALANSYISMKKVDDNICTCRNVQGEQEMYIECGEGGQPVPEDYLTFQSTGSPDPAQDNPQGMYEAMATDDPQDTYDEPGDHAIPNILHESLDCY